jgi:site-specific DNA-cytosine methylase
VQAWGDCCFVAEELSNVTTPSWAPAAWREMSTGGRHERVFIIGVAQNPALIDKTFLSNCTVIHVGPLREHRHRQTVARSMDLPVQELTDLVKFQWIQRDNDTKQVTRGWSYPPNFTPTGRPRTPSARGSADAGQQPGGKGVLGASKPLQPSNPSKETVK